MPPYDISTRAQALALKIGGRHSNDEIQRMTGITATSVNRIADRALERSLDLNNPVILDIHVADGARTGRPSKQAEAKDQILAKVQGDGDGREKTCAQIAAELDGQVSAMTVWRVLRGAGLEKTKPAALKPGSSTKETEAERPAWCENPTNKERKVGQRTRREKPTDTGT